MLLPLLLRQLQLLSRLLQSSRRPAVPCRWSGFWGCCVPVSRSECECCAASVKYRYRLAVVHPTADVALWSGGWSFCIGSGSGLAQQSSFARKLSPLDKGDYRRFSGRLPPKTDSTTLTPRLPPRVAPCLGLDVLVPLLADAGLALARDGGPTPAPGWCDPALWKHPIERFVS